MIPFKDDNPTRTFPFVTITLIAANIIVYFLQITSSADPVKIVYSYGAVPHFLFTFAHAQAVHPVLTVITSMFMHGGLFHLGSNMLFLWVFGDNVEDRLGHIKFFLFYSLCGAVAAYSHAITDPDSLMPMIGASGAVSGVLGAYLVLFPRARIHTLVFFGFFAQVVRLPALLVLGFWILIQFLNGILSRGSEVHAGVAWFAHIGGFIIGLILIVVFYKRRKRRSSPFPDRF